MVDSSLQQASEDKEAKQAWDKVKRKNLMPTIVQMFECLDTNGVGKIDIGQLRDAPEDVREALNKVAPMDDLEELFHILDFNDNGFLEIGEFCEGIMKTQVNKPLELLRIMTQCAHILLNYRSLCENLENAGYIPEEDEEPEVPVQAHEEVKTNKQKAHFGLGAAVPAHGRSSMRRSRRASAEGEESASEPASPTPMSRQHSPVPLAAPPFEPLHSQETLNW